MNFLSNPNLKTVKHDWPGTPLDKNGRFKNHIQPMTLGWRDVLKWQTGPKPHKEAKKIDTFRLKVHDANHFLTSSLDGIVWLGHASFLIRTGGKLIIIDPVFKSPSIFMKRYSALPFNDKLLNQIDYLLLSHDHRDHADKYSIKTIAALNPHMKYLTGLNLGPLLKSWTGSSQIQEAGWYQTFDQTSDLKISYVPSRHWGRRGLTDTNVRLWGGFILESPTCTLYFAGDSGYGPHFKEIATVFPNIDYAFIGIGAFRPEWFMSASHTSPADAYQAFTDTGAKYMVPMHYGTFDLSDEPLGEPHRLIRNINDERIKVVEVGQVLSI